MRSLRGSGGGTRARGAGPGARALAIGIVLALVCCAWQPGASTAANQTVRVPRVAGRDVVTAYHRLHAAGLRVSIPYGLAFDSRTPPRVRRTVPGAGHPVSRDSAVTLVLERGARTTGVSPRGLRSYVVPSFAGDEVGAAWAWLKPRGLILVAYLAPLRAGDAPGLLANYRITRQRPAAGARLARGRRRHGAFKLAPLIVWAAPPPPPSPPPAQGGRYENPVYGPAAMPDPFILDVTGRHADYWAYGTGDLFPILHSSDLVRWSGAGTAMAARPAWVTRAPDWHPWAPTVLWSDSPCPGASASGCYVMYYVGLSGTLNVNCVGVATSPAPGGPFVDRGPLDLATPTASSVALGCGDQDGRGNIDPSPFVDPSGQVYLYVSTDFACHAGSCTLKPTISVIPLAADRWHGAGPRIPLFSGDPGTWEAAGVQAPTVEGPSMELHNGTYYLLYSGGSWHGAYGMGYAASPSPTGPFTKAPTNPILVQSSLVLSPGGGDALVTGPRGGLWMFYHGRSSPDPAPRTLRLDRFAWVPGRAPGAPDVPVISGPTATPQPTQP